MSQVTNNDGFVGPNGIRATQKDAFFFLTILTNMKNKPDVSDDFIPSVTNLPPI
jgi:hypothetical protein